MNYRINQRLRNNNEKCKILIIENYITVNDFLFFLENIIDNYIQIFRNCTQSIPREPTH